MRGRLRLLSHQFAVMILVGTVVRSGLTQDCHVNAIVRVLDKHGQPVVNVTADELKAEINGSPANISSFSPSEPGIILMLDVSPSMKRTWNQSIAAARQLVGRAGEDIDIVAFREGIQSYAVGHSKSEELLDQLSKNTPSGLGGTALYDTLIEIAGRVNPKRNAAIIVISDGGDNISHRSSDATASIFLRSSWPPVFGLILDYDQTDTHRGYFKKIPTATGGLVAYPSSASKVPIAMEELSSVVLSPFTLTLQPTRAITGMAKLKLEVFGPEGKPRKDLNLIHVTEIPGCESQGSAHH